jgi:hypothetical protein
MVTVASFALAGSAAQGFRRDQGLASRSQWVRRPRIIGSGNAANLAVPHVAEAAAMAKDMEGPGVAVLQRSCVSGVGPSGRF